MLFAGAYQKDIVFQRHHHYRWLVIGIFHFPACPSYLCSISVNGNWFLGHYSLSFSRVCGSLFGEQFLMLLSECNVISRPLMIVFRDFQLIHNTCDQNDWI